MKTATYLAFLDELEKISFAKEASFMTNLGTRIVNTAKAAPRAIGGFAKSLPGHARTGIQQAGQAVSAFGTPIESLKRGVTMTTKDFHSMSPAMKALMGIGLVGSAHEALSKTDPLGQGRERPERVGAAIGDQVGGLIGTPFGVAGSLVAGQIGRKAGGLVGKGVGAVSKLRQKNQPVGEN